MATLTALGRRIDQVVNDAGGELSGNTLPRVNALVRELDGNSRQLTRLLDKFETSPQALLFGTGPVRPAPGEAGFVPPGN